MAWRCKICGVDHDELPTCFGIEAPWRALVPEDEFSRRVRLTADQCMIDDATYFVRGHVQIPIQEFSEPLALSVWSSLSEKSFYHMCERWESPERATDLPYFGWLSTSLPGYPETGHLKTLVHTRPVGIRPWIELEPTAHPLAVEQREGITLERVREIAELVLHGQEGAPP